MKRRQGDTREREQLVAAKTYVIGIHVKYN